MVNGTASARARWCVSLDVPWITLIESRIYLDNILMRGGPFTDEEWVPGEETITSLEQSKVL